MCNSSTTTDAHLAGNHAGLEQLFRARVIAFLVEARLLPVDRARMLHGWVHSGFQVHQSRRIAANECQDMERLAQYIVRNPFSVAKMQVNRSGDSILYRSGMNAKIKRNFQVFTACDFIAAITQHIPDKRFQMVRYYCWYSKKMRGQRRKRAEEAQEEAARKSAATAEQECGAKENTAIQIIEHFPPKARRIPSRSWRELIKKVWEVDPLLCPQCQHENMLHSGLVGRPLATLEKRSPINQLSQPPSSRFRRRLCRVGLGLLRGRCCLPQSPHLRPDREARDALAVTQQADLVDGVSDIGVVPMEPAVGGHETVRHGAHPARQRVKEGDSELAHRMVVGQVQLVPRAPAIDRLRDKPLR